MKTDEDFLDNVRDEGGGPQGVTKKLRTLEICQVAVHEYGSALQFVPPQLRTLEMCRVAVESDEDAIDFVNKKLLIKLVKESQPKIYISKYEKPDPSMVTPTPEILERADLEKANLEKANQWKAE